MASTAIYRGLSLAGRRVGRRSMLLHERPAPFVARALFSSYPPHEVVGMPGLSPVRTYTCIHTYICIHIDAYRCVYIPLYLKLPHHIALLHWNHICCLLLLTTNTLTTNILTRTTHIYLLLCFQ
jgi:hypothetical protein